MKETFLYRPNCALCASGRTSILVSSKFTEGSIWDFLQEYYANKIETSDLSNGKFEVLKCKDCGFIWQAYILNDKMMGKLYEHWVPSERGLIAMKSGDVSFFRKYARQIEAIPDLVQRKPHQINVLDFGMGWGYWCLMAKAYGYNAWGFDIAEHEIEFARKNGIAVISSFDEIAKHKFHFINAEQIFEHIPNPLQTLKTLVQALNTDGCIRISVPDGTGIESKIATPKWRPAKDAIHPLEHINCFTHRSLAKLGKLAGLKVINQPVSINDAFTMRSYVRALVRKYYLQYFGTALYFKKID